MEFKDAGLSKNIIELGKLITKSKGFMETEKLIIYLENV